MNHPEFYNMNSANAHSRREYMFIDLWKNEPQSRRDYM
jgi:hypothetical protein